LKFAHRVSTINPHLAPDLRDVVREGGVGVRTALESLSEFAHLLVMLRHLFLERLHRVLKVPFAAGGACGSFITRFRVALVLDVVQIGEISKLELQLTTSAIDHGLQIRDVPSKAGLEWVQKV